MPARLSLAGVLLLALSGAAVQGAKPLADRAEIRRDTYGVPHILAEDVEAGGYAFGYAMAEDHAAEIGRRYLQARGEASAHFGAAELDNDFAMRRLGNREVARRAVREDAGRDFRRWLEGFAAGVNAYTAAHRDRLPSWMPVVEPSDPIAYGRMFGVLAATRPPRALLEKYGVVGGFVGPPAPPDEEGSNAFALAGSRTSSRRPILLGNPHLTWSSLYWEAHVTIPGRVDFYGSTLVGIPVLRAGFNDRVAYVQTNNAPDLEDIYRLTLVDGRLDRYVHEGREWPITRRAVVIGSERREFEETRLGPVVHRAAGFVFVVRSMNLEWTRNYEGFFELQRARSLRQFRRTLGRRLTVTSNYTYADAEGNILYAWNARLPKRRDEADYRLDVAGDTRRLFWRGIHDLDDLPSLLNPSSGYVQNANNPPWWTSTPDPIDRARYPGYIEEGQLSLRAQLALEELDARATFSVDDVRALKFTTRLLAAERALPELLAAARAVPDPSEPLQAGIAVLSAWDRKVAAGSRGAVLFDRVLALRDGDGPWSAEGLERAVLDVRQRYGSESVAWGEVHRFRIGGLDLPGNGGPGRHGIYRVVNFEPAPDGRRVAGRASPDEPLAGGGDAWVLLVHFTRPIAAWSVLAYGQTTDLASPHSRDQIALFAAGQLRPVWFSDAEIAANLERRYRPGDSGGVEK